MSLARRLIGTALLAAAFLLTAGPSLACPPTIPGQPEPKPPTPAELASSIAESSDVIAYGVVVEPSHDSYRFKVLHVYRGGLRKGQLIDVQSSWGFSPPSCSGMITPPPPRPGMYGLIAYQGMPELSVVPDEVVQELIASGLIKSARTPTNR